MTAEELARKMHEAYERLAPEHGWETQERSRVEWEDVPDENRSLMIACIEEVFLPIFAEVESALDVAQEHFRTCPNTDNEEAAAVVAGLNTVDVEP